MRSLLVGTPMRDSGALDVGWCAGISVLGYLWSRQLSDRRPRPSPAR